jgi:SAM-dependent methyltransferase
MTALSFHALTESPGLPASREQLARLFHRYRFARDFAEGGDILEMACGAGIGLGYLARAARSVIGGDIDPANVACASSTYADTPVAVRFMDALATGLPDASFDLIILFEALYYLSEPDRFVDEAQRLLRPGGTLLVCTVNPAWKDFHPSPHITSYFTAPQLAELLGRRFKSVSLHGAFSTAPSGVADRMISRCKRLAMTFHLIPGSLAARNYLKRLVFGPLKPIPAVLGEDSAPYMAPEPVAQGALAEEWKILYAIGQL